MDWKEGYREAMLTVMARRAYVIDPRGDYYGWEDYDASSDLRDHMATCAPSLTLSDDLAEDSWDEFMGTFYEGDTRCHGVQVAFACACGKLQRVPLRLAIAVGELTALLLKETD